ncbi:PREDICTED: importin subunit alpha-like [Cyphomyrmex costatus]|uniref:importin subunit alpha-like n=1 Tax=Cyphomyrmex costatus TaxID=456900 RepID=UPI0008523267|nr:PREDICTED: importin subunit alpha-like [Cyphomyrmex costatus]
MAIQDCRKLLSREKNPPINDIIEGGIVPYLIELLDEQLNIPLQFEVTWILNNIASGTSVQTQNVIKHGAIPKLVYLLKSSSSNVAEQATWALGNIVADEPYARDFVLECGALPLLSELIKPDTSVTFMRNIVWTLSYLSRNKNIPPPFELIKPVLPIFNRLLDSTDRDVLVLDDICWALSDLTDGSNDKIQAVLEAGIIPKLVEMLTLQELSILTPALRTVGNIVTGNDAQTDAVIHAGGLSHLGALLRFPHAKIVKEAAWAISNIMAGNEDQIQSAIDAGLLSPLIEVLQFSPLLSSSIVYLYIYENAWAISNIMAGNEDQIQSAIDAGLLSPLIEVLQFEDYKSQIQAAWAITNLTKRGTIQHLSQLVEAGVLPPFWKIGQAKRLAITIEEAGGLDKIEALQYHSNEKISQKSKAIIDAFFSQKDHKLLKRRNLRISNRELSDLSNKADVSLTSINEIIKHVKSSDETLQLMAIHACRKLLSRRKNPPINDIIEGGIVPCFIELLDNLIDIPLQFEVTWILTKIASGTSVQTQNVIKQFISYGAIPKLVNLLKSSSRTVAEQAAWALRNIAEDACDDVLKHDTLPLLLKLIKLDISVTLMRKLIGNLCNLCRNQNAPFELIKPVLPIFNDLLNYADRYVLADTCWTLFYLTNGSKDAMQAVLETGIVPKLVEMLNLQERIIITPALRTVVNITSGNDAQTNAVIHAGGLSHLGALLRFPHAKIVKEAAWAISNIMAGNEDQIQSAIDAGLLSPLIEVLQFRK